MASAFFLPTIFGYMSGVLFKKKTLFVRLTLIEFLVNGGSYDQGKTKDRFLLGG